MVFEEILIVDPKVPVLKFGAVTAANVGLSVVATP